MNAPVPPLDLVDNEGGEHCDHHRHDGGCEAWAGLCDLNEDDDCVHCECCCTCLACEYGPQDGMRMFPLDFAGGGEVR